MVPRKNSDSYPSYSSPWLPSSLQLPPAHQHPMFLIHIRAEDGGRVFGVDEESAAEESKGRQNLCLRSQLEGLAAERKHDAVFFSFQSRPQHFGMSPAEGETFGFA